MLLFMAGLILGFGLAFIPRIKFIKTRLDMLETKIDELINRISKN